MIFFPKNIEKGFFFLFSDLKLVEGSVFCGLCSCDLGSCGLNSFSSLASFLIITNCGFFVVFSILFYLLFLVLVWFLPAC